MKKSLIVFYSRKGENHMPGGIQVLEKGNTEYAAEHIAKAVGADLFEIDTVTPYAENYRACCGQAVAEKKEVVLPNYRYVDGDSVLAAYILAKDYNEEMLRMQTNFDNTARQRENAIQAEMNKMQQKMQKMLMVTCLISLNEELKY